MATSSNAPTSQEHLKMAAEWKRVKEPLQKNGFTRSPFVPGDFNEYVHHRSEFIKSRKLEIQCKQLQNKADSEYKIISGVPLGINAFSNARGEGLAYKTIWSVGWKPSPDHPLAPWPKKEELKEEGDERSTSGFGRFIPLPRVPGNPTVAWKQKSYIVMLPLDFVLPVPKKFNIPLPIDYAGFQPAMDENGVYIDDPLESGDEAILNNRAAAMGNVAGNAENAGLPFAGNRARHMSNRSHAVAIVPPQLSGQSERRFTLNPLTPAFVSTSDMPDPLEDVSSRVERAEAADGEPFAASVAELSSEEAAVNEITLKSVLPMYVYDDEVQFRVGSLLKKNKPAVVGNSNASLTNTAATLTNDPDVLFVLKEYNIPKELRLQFNMMLDAKAILSEFDRVGNPCVTLGEDLAAKGLAYSHQNRPYNISPESGSVESSMAKETQSMSTSFSKSGSIVGPFLSRNSSEPSNIWGNAGLKKAVSEVGQSKELSPHKVALLKLFNESSDDQQEQAPSAGVIGGHLPRSIESIWKDDNGGESPGKGRKSGHGRFTLF